MQSTMNFPTSAVMGKGFAHKRVFFAVIFDNRTHSPRSCIKF